MNTPLGLQLRIRAMIHVAGEPIPLFWPMRTFIHHNPLHGLEDMPFERAVEVGGRLFHARGYLPRSMYQRYLAEGRVDRDTLTACVHTFVAQRPALPGVDLARWLMALLTAIEQPVMQRDAPVAVEDLSAVLAGRALTTGATDAVRSGAALCDQLLGARPVYEAVDHLFGTRLGVELDELVIKSCLDFFDEGQSVWEMPGREQGFFHAWAAVARRNVRFFLRGLHLRRILDAADTPEGVIAHVLVTLGIDEAHWQDYFSNELARLHGWAGFIRWRASAKRYYWAQRFPADLVDYMAIRLTLGLALLNERGRRHLPNRVGDLRSFIEARPEEAWLRHELHTGQVLPAWAHPIEAVLLRGKPASISRTFAEYTEARRAHQARAQAGRLRALAHAAGEPDALTRLPGEGLAALMEALAEGERESGRWWLEALEAQAMHGLLDKLEPASPPLKRPFTQALFCIDVRSEPLRRHLEQVGDYQTFGIAGFFGVPVSFMELGKGSETKLCPVLLTPKNLVPEVTPDDMRSGTVLHALQNALHELKESVFTPFVTVEAIGLLFGVDMVGKTLAPQGYHRWRKHLQPHHHKPSSRLLIDKLGREEADSIVRAVQRAVVIQAVIHELHLARERITDDVVRALRECALGTADTLPDTLAASLGIEAARGRSFLARLRQTYCINRAFAQVQRERLGRIGFSLDEQVLFVGQALRAIGLTRMFSRFVLIVGHGSRSENNPYESALDCGACGGNHGLVSARILAQMGNRPEVRRQLREQGLDIPDDTRFISGFHNTTTDEISLHDIDLVPSSHLLYLDRLRNGLMAATRLSAQERLPSLSEPGRCGDAATAQRLAQRNALDWSQVRPEWGLSRNAYFVIGRRELTRTVSLEGRAFLHSYDYRIDPRRRLLETILTGPLVVGQWINMEHYFSTVDNERYGSGSKVYHNVAGRFGVMTGNLSDLRTGLPAQTVLKDGAPYHEPFRLITVIEAPFEHARQAVEGVVTVKRLVHNGWIRLLILDPDTGQAHWYETSGWRSWRWSEHPTPELSDIARRA